MTRLIAQLTLRRVAHVLAVVACLACLTTADAASVQGEYLGGWRYDLSLTGQTWASSGEFSASDVRVNTVGPTEMTVFVDEDGNPELTVGIKITKNNKKAKFVGSGIDLGQAEAAVDLIFQNTVVGVQKRKKKKRQQIPLPPTDLTSAKPKGSAKAKKKSTRVKLSLTYIIEGVVTGGEFQGQTFRGKLKATYDGARDFGF